MDVGGLTTEPEMGQEPERRSTTGSGLSTNHTGRHENGEHIFQSWNQQTGKWREYIYGQYPRPPVVPSEKVGLGWVPGGSKYHLRRYDEVGVGY